jgi:hypothetical protein
VLKQNQRGDSNQTYRPADFPKITTPAPASFRQHSILLLNTLPFCKILSAPQAHYKQMVRLVCKISHFREQIGGGGNIWSSCSSPTILILGKLSFGSV